MKMTNFTAMMIAALFVVSILMIPMTTAVAARTYDLVILNGRVMDPEIQLDSVMNVGIKGDKIMAVAKDNLKGKEVIDDYGRDLPLFYHSNYHFRGFCDLK